MRPVRVIAGFAALALAIGLAACNRGSESGATSNANAPGSPGTGNEKVVVQPVAPDGPPGGPSGIKGSAPHPGSSGGDMAAGTSGTGVAGAGPAAGSGLTGSFPA